MSAVDRSAILPIYRKNKALAAVRAHLDDMDEAQREKMRAAHEWVNGGHTHLPDHKTRPPRRDEKRS